MKCRVLHDYSNLELVNAGLLPAKYKDTINLFVFGMESEDGKKDIENLLGIVVFSTSSRFSVMNLLHISIRGKEKENEYAKELFDYAINQLRQISVKAIEFKEAVSKEEKSRYSGLFSYLGLKTECKNASVMICRQGVFQGQKLDRVYELASKYEGKIVMIQNYFDVALRDFFEKNTETRFYISFSEYNPKYSSFYMEDGEIKAAVFARKQENGDVLVDGCYIDKNINQPYILPYLISVIGYRNKDEIDTTKKLFINVYNEGMIDAVMQFMSEENVKEIEIKDLVHYKYYL